MRKITKLKIIFIYFLLVIPVLFINTQLADASYSTGNTTYDRLLDLAQSKLNGEYRVLLSGNIDDAKDTKLIITGKAEIKEKDILDTKLRINKAMSDSSLKYTKFSSVMKIQSADVKENEASLKVIEAAELNVENKDKENTLSKSENIHTFNFIKQNGIWIIGDDIEEGEQIDTAPIDSKYRVTDPNAKIQGRPTDKGKKISSGVQKSFLSLLGFIKPVFAYSGIYNPQNAVNYARSYWNNYNTAYRSFDSDCTNFTSQAINWGGWQHVGGIYNDAHYWWYSPNYIPTYLNDESLSWVNTTYWWYFARYANRVTNATAFLTMNPGDILQVDQGAPNGVLDHTYIVTKKDSYTIYLSAHSNNHLDQPLPEVYASWPGANWYGSVFKTQY